jgi:hypothetical protein
MKYSNTFAVMMNEHFPRERRAFLAQMLAENLYLCPN